MLRAAQFQIKWVFDGLPGEQVKGSVRLVQAALYGCARRRETVAFHSTGSVISRPLATVLRGQILSKSYHIEPGAGPVWVYTE